MDSLEIFSGAGGLALGLQKAGFNHVALYERNEAACRNLNYNIAKTDSDVKRWNVIHADVRHVDYGKYEGKIQLLAGGPPCQPFSLGGKHQAQADDRDMFPEAVRAIRETKPVAFLLENVQGLLRQSFKTYFDYILLQLMYPETLKSRCSNWLEHLAELEKAHTGGCREGLSYRVVFRLLNAADYGIPQIRQRVMIVGFRNDCNVNWSFPAPTHSKEMLMYSKWISREYWSEHNLPVPKDIPLSVRKTATLRNSIEGNLFNVKRWLTVRDAIRDLPDPATNFDKDRIFNHEYRAGAKSYHGHSGSNPDEPSKAIKAGVHGVPGGENMLMIDNGELRYYTVRESARIQTFPDNYVFVSSLTENMRQIGNAVPVDLAYVIGKSIHDKLRGA